MLSQHSAFAAAPINSLISPMISREVAYATLSYINAEKMGIPRSPRLQTYVDIMLGHVDQWLFPKTIGAHQIAVQH